MSPQRPAPFIAIILVTILSFSSFCLSQDVVALVGSGSSLPDPLYASWTEEYNRHNPAVQVRYMPLGTSEGINQITHGVGDFGAGEVPISEEQMRSSKLQLLHVPTVMVGIVPIYNLPGTAKELKFSGTLLAEIFLRKIKNWNDPRLARLNPGVALPSLPVKIVHRSEGKGSNYILTDYLSKVSPEFQTKIGRSPSPQWPGGLSTQRSEDMVTTVKSVLGAIGYVELDYALKSELGIGRVENASGEFVAASQESILAALKGKTIPADFRVSLTNAPAKGAYPITSFTWLYVPVTGLSPQRALAMKDFLHWVLTTGQTQAQKEGYAPLPDSLLEKIQARLETIH